jgi:hypothetical protein
MVAESSFNGTWAIADGNSALERLVATSGINPGRDNPETLHNNF